MIFSRGYSDILRMSEHDRALGSVRASPETAWPTSSDHPSKLNPENRRERNERECFKRYTYEELTKRDKPNLDIFWLKDESLEDSANLPAPDIVTEIDSRILHSLTLRASRPCRPLPRSPLSKICKPPSLLRRNRG
jgi:hypothetical protein